MNIEQDVHDGIGSLDAHHGIVVAHRLSTVWNADRIYTMVDGRVEEVGTHENYLKWGNGTRSCIRQMDNYTMET